MANSYQELQHVLGTRGIGLIAATPLKQVEACAVKKPAMIMRARPLSVQAKIAVLMLLAQLLNSGIDMLQSLSILQAHVPPRVRQKLQQVMQELQCGFSFAYGIEKVDFFSSFECALIEVGEQAGCLPLVFKELATMLDERKKFEQQILRALIVPVTTLIVAVLVVLLLCHGVLPNFESLFLSMNKSVPRLSQMVFRLAGAVRRVPLLLYLAVMLGIFTALWLPSLRALLSSITTQAAWRVSMMRRVLIEYNLYYYLVAVRLYVVSGITFEEGLLRALAVVKNKHYHELLAELCKLVQQGYTISQASQQTKGAIPAEYQSLLAVGDHANQMLGMIERVTLLLQNRLMRRARWLVLSVGPAMLIVVGLLVCIVMFAVYVPIFTMVRVF